MHSSSHDRYAGLPALYSVIDRLARETSPASYLEIGVRDGASLVCALAAAPQIELLALSDTWESDYGGSGRASHQHIAVLLAALGATRNVMYLDGDSKVTLPPIRGRFLFDMIVVDGDHSVEGALADMGNAFDLLAGGGILIVDDISNPGHPQLGPAIKAFAEQRPLDLVEWDTRGVGAGAFRKIKR